MVPIESIQASGAALRMMPHLSGSQVDSEFVVGFSSVAGSDKSTPTIERPKGPPNDIWESVDDATPSGWEGITEVSFGGKVIFTPGPAGRVEQGEKPEDVIQSFMPTAEDIEAGIRLDDVAQYLERKVRLARTHYKFGRVHINKKLVIGASLLVVTLVGWLVYSNLVRPV
jgi:hypothetical protein